MTATRPRHSREKIIFAIYFVTCLLMYGVGSLILSEFHESMIGHIVVISFGLLILFTCPGLLISLYIFGKSKNIEEHIIIGFIVNIFIFPTILVISNIIGFTFDGNLLVGTVALLTALSGAMWIRNGTCPSLADAKGSLLWLLLSAFCLVAVVLMYPKEILTPIDQYIADHKLSGIANKLTKHNKKYDISSDYFERIAKGRNEIANSSIFNWTYNNISSRPEGFIFSILTNCNNFDIYLKYKHQNQNKFLEKRKLRFDELRFSSSHMPAS